MEVETLRTELALCDKKISKYQELRRKILEMIAILEDDESLSSSSLTPISSPPYTESSSKRHPAGSHRQTLIHFFLERENRKASQKEIIQHTGLHYSNLQYNLRDTETFERRGDGKDSEYRLTESFYSQKVRDKSE